MSFLFLGTGGFLGDGDYAADSGDFDAVWANQGGAVRVTDIGEGRKWIESPSTDFSGPRLFTPAWTARDEVVVGVRVKRGSAHEVPIFRAHGPSGNSWTARITSGGVVLIKQFFDSAIVYDGATDGSITIDLGDEPYIEIRFVKNGDGTADFTVHIDDVEDGAVMSVSTGFTWRQVGQIHFATGAANSDDAWRTGWRLTDWYVDTDTRRGPQHVPYLPASAAGSSSDWTPQGAATNHEAVDDVGEDGDGTYTEAGASGDADSLGHAAIGSAPNALQPIAIVRAEDGTTTAQLELGIRSGPTSDYAPAVSPGTSYEAVRGSIYETDPDTAAAWTEAGADAAELTYRVA